jgi:hypothetical protein
MTELTLYHYTCRHGRAALGRSGLVLPASQLTTRAVPWPAMFAWFTDLAEPDPHALGLTSYLVKCDRTAHRYRVTDATDVATWLRVARNLTRAQRDTLELEPGARPLLWYVATTAVPVVLDE